VKSSIGVVLFFLLSGFFLSALLGTLERSRKLLGVAGVCLVAVVLVLVFLTPVELPSWRMIRSGQEPASSSTTAVQTTLTSEGTGAHAQ
jgi:hypothetical protein